MDTFRLLFVSAAVLAGLANEVVGNTDITGTNVDLSDLSLTQQVVDTDGTPLTPADNAVVAIGRFNDPVNLTGFLALGTSSLNTSPLFPGIFGSLGATGITADLPNVGDAPGPFVGRTIFLIVYKSSDPLNFIAWNSGQTFEFETALDIGAPVSFITSTSNLVRGSVVPGGTNGLQGPLATANGNDAISFGPVLPTDTDLDGLGDAVETNTGVYVSPSDTGSNPNVADTDGDGLKDGPEVILYGTDPNKVDSDGDGFEDKFEIDTGFDPTSSSSSPDTTSEILTAVELRFFTGVGFTYRIEATDNLANWEIIEDGIVGSGGEDSRFYSAKDRPARYIRVRKN